MFHWTYDCGRRSAGVVRMALLAVLLALAVPAAAQTTGVVSGVLTDAQGGVLPGVSLTLRNVETGLTRTGITEADGTYHFAALPPGRYELTAELQGFANSEVKDIVVTVGTELRRNVTMKLQGVQEAVTVTAQSPIVETTKSDVSDVVTQRQIDTLPVNSRQTVTLALLLPGTSSDATRPRKTSVNVGAGSVFYSSSFLVDGTTNQEVKAGEPRQDFPQGAIREFKVNVSQATAEFGGTSGGVVTVVTKSGTNAFGGEVFEYFRDKALNTMNKFEQIAHDTKGLPKPNFRRNQYGVSAGGPIIKDKLHFFGAVDRTSIDQYAIVNTGKPQFYSALEGQFKEPIWNYMYFARGDWQVNNKMNAFVRWADNRNHVNCETCGGNQAALSGNGVEQNRSSLVAGHTWILSNHALNEARFQYAPFFYATDSPLMPSPYWDKTGDFSPERYQYMTQVYNFPSLSYGSNNSSIVTETWYEFKDEFSLNATWRGDHAWKVGFDYNNTPTPEDAPGVPPQFGTWTFAADQPFNPNDPASVAALTGAIQYTASYPPQPRFLYNHWLSAYVQDEWKPKSNVTLNLGLRYDNQINSFNQQLDLSQFSKTIPFINPKARGDNNNFGPRIGFAWDLKNDGRSVVRAGYGKYYRWIWTAVFIGEIINLKQTSIIVRNPTYPDPFQGKDPLTFASTALPNISIVDNGIRNPSAQMFNGGFSQQLAHNMAIHLDGVYVKTAGETAVANLNTPLEGATPGVAATPAVRPIAGWANISQAQSIGRSQYKALLARFEKRFERNYQFLISYTLSKCDNQLAITGLGVFPNITNYYHPDWDYGPCNADRRNALVASGAWLAPGGVTLGAIWTIRSTMPFSAVAGTDLNGDGAISDFVPGTTRNQGNRVAGFLDTVNAYRATLGLAPIPASQINGNKYNSVDLRASKAFPLGGTRKLEAIAQVFNVFGTDNLLASGAVGAWSTNARSSTFGSILQAFPRQQAELVVRLTW